MTGPKGPSPWFSAGPWRSFSPRPITLYLQLEGTEPTPVRVTCHQGGRDFTVETLTTPESNKYHITGRVGADGNIGTEEVADWQ